jgi:hypothetical protein
MNISHQFTVHSEPGRITNIEAIVVGDQRRLLVTDVNSNTLKLFDVTDLNCVDRIHLGHRWVDGLAVHGNRAWLMCVGEITEFSLSPRLTVIQSHEKPQRYWQTAYLDGDRLVGTHSYPDSATVDILYVTGEQLDLIPQHEFGRPYFVTCCASDIFVSEGGIEDGYEKNYDSDDDYYDYIRQYQVKPSVVCLSVTGHDSCKVRWIHDLSGRSPSGSTVYMDSLLVLCNNMTEIVQL